ncbi:amidase [Bradyrhizobium sp. ISRA443]|uniref:amidase n=1 Tax=unclassified Bradyrhizobium TaxID=2631580 RepID=UPI002479F58A|nr:MULTISPECIES: amidase [unclassified Bradyrhizobium]WGR91799.1 amidase [Bradyrhizobium sp. ISRA435]WGS02161.1 amidase [Bradyrhizobium sp. ISRA436]WGS09046.1 amidase [Bradyrhizobium sp. ISRA437]WGS15935.1 amidase [Bradyrhizobium sp. ISRA443]
MISLADLQHRIEQGALSAGAAIGQSLDAIRADHKTIGAFVRYDETAGAQTAGPLRGVAVGIKDIIDTADFPTEMGAQIYRDHRPRADAPVVMALKQAGATIIGKTTTTAFAANDPTATLNPHNHAHTSGGSSSGSAAAVAAGMIPLALGTQTGGSVIRPASFCGVAAIKPSYRLLPTVGVKCFSWTLDTVGLFAAGVRDVALGLAAMTNRPELVVPSVVPAPRIGVVTQAFAGAPEPSGAEAVQKASRAAERAGASVRELAMPEIVAEAWRMHPVVQDFEAHQSFAWEYRRNYDAMPPLLRGRLDESKGITAADYDAAMDVALRARQALAAVFDEVDVLLTLSAPGAAPEGLSSTGDPRYNRLWTLMGVPCVNVPAHVAEAGLPVGVTVIAPFGADARALAAASFVEDALKR